MEQQNQIKPKENKSLVSAFEWISSMITALIVVAIVFTFVFRIVGVEGESMCDTLFDADRLVLITQFYHLERGDIIVINRTDDKPLIKRVIAVAGDTVSIDEETQHVILNGEVLDEDYVKGGITPPFNLVEPYTVPEGYVFAMGDNRQRSKDSRLLGAFSVEDVIGKTVFRIWPTNAIGKIA